MVSAQGSAVTMRVLLVEDNPGDVRLVQEALRETGLPVDLRVATDGAMALDMLHAGRGDPADRPDLVLLDLNLPRVRGGEVLAQVKADDALRAIPVVVFSSSAAPADLRMVYEGGANCYVQKPTELDAYMDVVQRIEGFWLQLCRLPAHMSA